MLGKVEIFIMKTPYVSLLSLISITLLFSGCGPTQMKALIAEGPSTVEDGNSEDDGGICAAVRPQLASRVQAWNNRYPVAHLTSANAKLKLESAEFPTQLPKNFAVILVADRACVQNQLQNSVWSSLQSQISNARADLMSDQSILWKLPTAMSFSSFERLITSIPCLKVASPNGKMELTAAAATPQSLLPAYTPNDTYYSTLNHFRSVRQTETYKKLFGYQIKPQNKVVVAVIDTGNDMDHADMVGQHWGNAREINGIAGVDDDNNGYIDDFYGWGFPSDSNDISDHYWFPHGSHVAGLIGALTDNGLGVAGIASRRVKIMHLSVFSQDPSLGHVPDPMILVENALRYATDNGAKVINLSLGRNGGAQSLYHALKYATDRGVVVVASAGNNNREIDASFAFAPAIYASELQGMLSVAATDASPHEGQTFLNTPKCGFSNYSTTYVDIAAPGCDQSPGHPDSGLLSTGWLKTVGQYREYASMAGTSMAAPLVAGAAANVISYILEKSGVAPTNALVEHILKTGSRQQSTLENYVSEKRALDQVELFSYIDRTILELPTECQ